MMLNKIEERSGTTSRREPAGKSSKAPMGRSFQMRMPKATGTKLMFVSAATSSAKHSLCCHKGPSSRVRDCARRLK